MTGPLEMAPGQVVELEISGNTVAPRVRATAMECALSPGKPCAQVPALYESGARAGGCGRPLGDRSWFNGAE